MNPPTISLNAETAPDYQASMNFNSYINTATDDNNDYAPKILKDHSRQSVSSLVHEVRNPLTNINLSVEMLESAIKDNDLKIYLDIIMRSSIRISNLIKELLKYQEADEVQVEKHSIHQLLDEVLDMAEDRITLKNIVIRKDYATEDFKIVLNNPKMKIALTNIIINAIDAMTSENGELKLVTKSIDGKYIIEIEDNGCGISKENLKYIFKPYFTNKPGGLGFGLATTYDILRLNHVGIKVESGEGEGTRFTLLFDKIYQYNPFNKLEIDWGFTGKAAFVAGASSATGAEGKK